MHIRVKSLTELLFITLIKVDNRINSIKTHNLNMLETLVNPIKIPLKYQ